MPRVDPNDEKYESGGGGTEKCGPGAKLLVAVGFERYSSSRKGTPMIGIRWLCLHDFNGNDEKRVAFDNVANTANSMWRFAAIAKALGYSDMFDTDDDEDLWAMLSSGYLVGKLQNETYQGKTQAKLKFYDEPDGDFQYDDDPDWATWIEEAEEGHQRYLDWRAEHPRGESGGGSGGSRGGGRRRGSRSRSYGGGGYDGPDTPPASAYDDVPF